jgi:hypothetical protein
MIPENIILIAQVLAWADGCPPDEVKRAARPGSLWLDSAQECSDELEEIAELVKR